MTVFFYILSKIDVFKFIKFINFYPKFISLPIFYTKVYHLLYWIYLIQWNWWSRIDKLSYSAKVFQKTDIYQIEVQNSSLLLRTHLYLSLPNSYFQASSVSPSRLKHTRARPRKLDNFSLAGKRQSKLITI